MACKRLIVELVSEIATENDLELEALSQDWILRLTNPSTSRAMFIFGYNFSVNPASSAQICQDKSATYLCLSAAGVPCVPHTVFFNPADPLVAGYISAKSGSISQILKCCQEQYNNRVVLKPLKGTGGNGVVRAFNTRDIESAILQLFQKDYGLVVSPYRTILKEIRAIVLFGSVKLMYSKERFGVVGDGFTRLLDLIVSHLQSHPSHARLVDFGALNCEQIPWSSEFIPFEWRHNLGHGASVQIVNDSDASSLAIATATALNMQFCSVDMIITSEDPNYSVLEVNAGVMMDAFASFSDANRVTAKRIYEEAILGALARGG